MELKVFCSRFTAVACKRKLLPKTLRLMKLVLLLTMVGTLQAWSNARSQTVTLSVKGAPLEKVFKEIQKQTGFSFIYTKEDLHDARVVSLQVKDATLPEVLGLCFKDQPLGYTVEENQIVVTRKQDARVITEGQAGLSALDVKGKVVNESGDALESISVVIKGTGKGTSTDGNGIFEFKGVDENATLIFSGISVETFELPLKGRHYVEVGLKSRVTELGNVSVEVNTGYQQLPKERATGSFTRINREQFNQQVTTDVLSRLEGISNGVSFGRKNYNSTGQMHIRGLSTINGPQNPLIVLDDFPYEGNIANLNPNDVESITILKDAAAASIWGARAANGVVVITTKKSRYNQRTSIEVTTNLKLIDKPDLGYVPAMPSSDFIDVEQMLFNKGYRFSDTANSARPPFTPVYEILFRQRRGELTAQQASDQINQFRNLDIRKQYEKYFYSRNLSQQYAVNMKGGSGNIAWLLSLGMDKNLDEVSALNNRFTAHYTNTIKLSKKLELTTGFFFIESESKNGRPRFGSIYSKPGNLPPYTSFADGQGHALAVMKDFRQPYIDTAGAGKLFEWNYYPLEDYKHTTSRKSTQEFLGKIGLEYKITNSLGVTVNYQYENQQSHQRDLNDMQSYFTRNLVNLFTQLNRSTGQATYKIPVGSILDATNGNIKTNNLRTQLGFNKSFLKHQLSAIAGGEVREIRTGQDFNRFYGYDDDILTSANVDQTTAYPTFIKQSFFSSTAFVPSWRGFSGQLNRFISFYSNAAYTYSGKYTFSLSGRKDASNIFGVSVNHKWNPLWSAGFRWEVSKESFYHIPVLSYLSLRSSYGYNGNLDPSLSALTTVSYLGTSVYTSSPMARVDKFYNPDLRWEKNGQWNFAADFATDNRRVSGSVDYYKKNGRGLYGPALLDYTAGLSNASITKNVASMKGHGWEIQLNTLNIDGRLKWSTQWNLNTYHDQITSYYLSYSQGNAFMGNGISGLVGSPVYSVFSYPWAGLDPSTGDPIGYLKGSKTENYAALLVDSIQNLRFNGPALPTFFGTLGNTVSWKNFSLSAALLFKMGHYFKRNSIEYSLLFQSLTGHPDYNLRWQKPGDELTTNVPSMTYPASPDRDAFYRNSEILVEKADNIRLQFVTLGYDLDSRIGKLTFIKHLRLYVNANDLGIIWRANKRNIDPEYLNGVIPPPKNYVFGIRASF